jgi:hypothetical protein
METKISSHMLPVSRLHLCFLRSQSRVRPHTNTAFGSLRFFKFVAIYRDNFFLLGGSVAIAIDILLLQGVHLVQQIIQHLLHAL